MPMTQKSVCTSEISEIKGSMPISIHLVVWTVWLPTLPDYYHTVLVRTAPGHLPSTVDKCCMYTFPNTLREVGDWIG